MKLNFNCIKCNVNQVIQVMDLFKAERSKKEEAMREVLTYLSKTDYDRCNPEVIEGTWRIILKHIEKDDPYKDIKKYYNYEVLKIEKEVEKIIENSKNKFNTALKIVIAGNLIDFAAGHEFNIKMLEKQIANIEKTKLAIDDSEILYEHLKGAKSIIYLGDNCGEICLDKIFIKYIKKEFPNIKAYFGVRGKAIVNDVTIEDAQMVNMKEVAEVIDNGDGSLGTVISRVSSEFKNKFYDVDVIIAKGQGNYESLCEVDRENIFHLFMAKCEPVAKSLDVKTMSIVCVKNKKRQIWE
ncbi:damage-control phosphatase ARMT1 family protein [Clostridium hydrogenum]|uniref:damage-control phosphatase ARMT1 family protein n=1 Tax=Clostridium hydrogenum TaxID=2855764 RepID=UPI002E3000B0|nr:ARMT1-like domain-containing protein [Clostridium hydrogenum]